MPILEKTIKISSKGQITLPKQARERLKTDVVRIVVEEDGVRIEPVKELAGNLSQYAKPFVSHKEARDRAWAETVREKHLRD